MQRLGTGNPGDGIHQLLLDLAALDVHGDIRVIHNGLAEKNLFQLWSQIHGHKAELLPGALIVHLGNVNKAILELVDDVVVFLPAFREDDQRIASCNFSMERRKVVRHRLS